MSTTDLDIDSISIGKADLPDADCDCDDSLFSIGTAFKSAPLLDNKAQ